MLRYRYLFEQMVRRELRQKYQGSALGVLWYVVNPLVLMGAYALIFGVLLSVGRTYPDYPVFIFVGLIAWLFFSQSLLAGASSLVDHSSLVSKVRFPRETVPAAVATVQMVPFLAMLAIVAPVVIALRDSFGPALLLVVPVVVCLYAFTLGLALIAAALHAYFRDVQPVLAAALLPMFFVTPIFFEVQKLPGLQDHRWLEPLLRWVNPVAPFIDAVRSPLYDGRAPSGATLAYVLAAAALALAAGVRVFRRLEPELAVVL